MSERYWGVTAQQMLAVLKETGLAPKHISEEFASALLDDDKRETDTTIRDELQEYERD